MFDCNGCCFADSDGDQQVGCKAQKHECVGFSKSDSFFELDRLCLYKRSESWESDKTTEEKFELARNQLFPNIGICLDDDSEDPSDLENIINQILNLEYPKNRIKVVIYSRFGKAGARIPKILTKLRSNGVDCYSVFIVQENVFENETSVFTKLSKATFLTKLSSKAEFDLQKSVDQINKISNDELRQVLVFKNRDAVFINKTYVSKSYLEHLDYSKMQDDVLKKVNDTEFLYIIE